MNGWIWLIGFYPKGPIQGIFVSSKAHLSLPTHSLSDQGDLLVVRPGNRNQVTCTEGEKINRCLTDLTVDGRMREFIFIFA